MDSPRKTTAKMKMDLDLTINLVAWVIYCFAVLLLLLYLYLKYCVCCKWRTNTNPSLEESHHQIRHTMVGTVSDERRGAIIQAADGPQPYANPSQGLPSYETVCRKDKQGYIYRMIAKRFNIIGSHHETPPTYEESLLHALPPVDVNLPAYTQDESSNLGKATQSLS